MRRPSDIVIQKVLDEKASVREAEEVALWFSTEEGRAWVENDMREKADTFFDERQLEATAIPTEEMFREINRKIERILTKRRTRKFVLGAAASLSRAYLLF